MSRFKHGLLVAAVILAVVGCAQSAPPAADTAADEAAIRAADSTWFAAYNAGDVDGVAALYADDAVVSVPGAPPARGSAAIREALARDMEGTSKGGFTLTPSATPETGASGDLGYIWNTFKVTDKSGATVDAGKYLTLAARKDGKWRIIRDIWNSDSPPAPPAAAASAN